MLFLVHKKHSGYIIRSVHLEHQLINFDGSYHWVIPFHDLHIQNCHCFLCDVLLYTVLPKISFVNLCMIQCNQTTNFFTDHKIKLYSFQYPWYWPSEWPSNTCIGLSFSTWYSTINLSQEQVIIIFPWQHIYWIRWQLMTYWLYFLIK